MWVLGLDSSTLTASVAVARDGEVVARAEVATRAHGDVLLATIDRVVRDAQLAPTAIEVVAVGAGPGSFTGLRIGMATAKGIAFAAGARLHVISSLAALAFDAGLALADAGIVPLADALLVPALDARRGEAYVGFYRLAGGAVTPVAPEVVLAPGAIAAAIDAHRGADPAVVVGDALTVYRLAFAAPIHAAPELRATPSGAAVALLAATGAHRDALTDGAPQYIRPAEAELKYPDGVPGALPRRPR